MGEIMNSPKKVKSGVPERVSISCPTCGTRHDVSQITGKQSYVTVSEQTIQHIISRVKCIFICNYIFYLVVVVLVIYLLNLR